MAGLRVLITSSRTWDDEGFVWRVLDTVFEPLDEMVLVHGACPEGGDEHADRWARENMANGFGEGLTVRRRPANWARHGRRAGRVRNVQMVEEGVDLCLAFARLCADPKCRRKDSHITHGTEHCSAYALGSGVETRLFPYETRNACEVP